jgi:hypothetical protein
MIENTHNCVLAFTHIVAVVHSTGLPLRKLFTSIQALPFSRKHYKLSPELTRSAPGKAKQPSLSASVSGMDSNPRSQQSSGRTRLRPHGHRNGRVTTLLLSSRFPALPLGRWSTHARYHSYVLLSSLQCIWLIDMPFQPHRTLLFSVCLYRTAATKFQQYIVTTSRWILKRFIGCGQL